MQDTILRSEAWKFIDSGASFNIDFVLADRRRGVAGEFRSLKRMQKVQQEHSPADQDGARGQRRDPRDLSKDPNHGLHKTVNIHCPSKPNQHIYKIHYRLFDRFNGKTVIS